MGYYSTASSGPSLIEQWGGTSWKIVANPNPGSSYNSLNGVTALSATSVWAVGYANNRSGNPATLIEQWDGTSWTIVSSPNSSSPYNSLIAVTSLPHRGLMSAVGYRYDPSTQVTQTLVEYC